MGFSKGTQMFSLELGTLPVSLDDKIEHIGVHLNDIETLIGLGYASYAPAHAIAVSLLQRVDALAQTMERMEGRSISGIRSRVFGTKDPTGTGSVGTDETTILQIIHGDGNLRETMTTIYAAAKFYNSELGSPHVYHYMSQIAKLHHETFDSDSTRTNQWLERQGLDFIHLEFILRQQTREEDSGALHSKTSQDPVFLPFGVPPMGGSVFEARVRNDIRYLNRSLREAVLVSDVLPVLGKYEAKLHSEQFHGDPYIHWLPGGGKNGRWKIKEYLDRETIDERYTTNPVVKIPFQQGLPMLAGPSGTAERFMLIANYLGLSEDEQEMLKFALIGWMVPASDHTIYEILQALDERGVKGTRMDNDIVHMVTHQILEAPVDINGHLVTPKDQIEHQAQVYRHYTPCLTTYESAYDVLQRVEDAYRHSATELQKYRTMNT
mmetsp:Transcript_26818/g.57723  ORF Transcript_26818/g.57723 Transcript_26818/m.57723 type:complete len:436 (+) Transcript_26818:40-1347(+)